MSPSTLSWVSQKHPERGLPWKRDVLRTTGVPVRTMLGKRKKKVGGSLNEWLDLNHYRPVDTWGTDLLGGVLPQQHKNFKSLPPQIPYDSRCPHPEKSTKNTGLDWAVQTCPSPCAPCAGPGLNSWEYVLNCGVKEPSSTYNIRRNKWFIHCATSLPTHLHGFSSCKTT